MRILRAADHRRMAWKNGGGETVEVAVHPPGAGLADFDWRVSMARVASDGPFSTFPDVDRTLAVLGGAGLDLDIAGHSSHRLTMASTPLSFPADAATASRLIDGPITDLNIMTRRGRWQHALMRLATGCRIGIASEPDVRMVLCFGGEAEAYTADGRLSVQAGDALLADEPGEVVISGAPGACLWLVSLRSVQAGRGTTSR